MRHTIKGSKGRFTATHGMSQTREYKSWQSMKQRVLNPKSPDYPFYGKKGVKICPQWIDDFLQFLSDLGERPEGMTLDRIDPTGDYTPENTRWNSPKGQAQNRRYNRKLSFNGETHCIEEWSRRMNIPSSLLHWRLSKGKWSVAKCLTEPVNYHKKAA